MVRRVGGGSAFRFPPPQDPWQDWETLGCSGEAREGRSARDAPADAG